MAHGEEGPPRIRKAAILSRPPPRAASDIVWPEASDGRATNPQSIGEAPAWIQPPELSMG